MTPETTLRKVIAKAVKGGWTEGQELLDDMAIQSRTWQNAACQCL